ncbi:MAG: hypothetical protein EOM15_14675 [Spirochaetia bacterium]|nr:hypothetical protein [Spirochaetia bacterium]
MNGTTLKALHYETLVLASRGSEKQASHTFEQLQTELDITQPLLLHIDRYAAILGVQSSVVSDAYYLSQLKIYFDNKEWKELIDYICNEFFNDSDRIFLQNLRQFRNQISYEGFNVPESFLERNNTGSHKQT